MNWLRRRQREDEIKRSFDYLFDDDIETAMAGYLHITEAESSRGRRDPDAPPRQIVERDHAMGHARIMADYFGPNPIYTDGVGLESSAD